MKKTQGFGYKCYCSISCAGVLAFTLVTSKVQAKSITAANDGTGIQVTQTGNQWDISGGSLSGNGDNLFHSFTQFGLNAGDMPNGGIGGNFSSGEGGVIGCYGGEDTVLTGELPQFDLIDPNQGNGTGFGTQIVPLSTGNVVVTKPGDNFAADNAGAVYLYNGKTGELISTLTGAQADDRVGSHGVVPLTNGNYVVLSPDWDNGGISDAGALTWGDGNTGISGEVNPSNSLVGSTADDKVGSNGVVALTNGNYVVLSSWWDNGGVSDAGAATWGNGSRGISGEVNPSNSLVGSQTDDEVGWDGCLYSDGVVALTNGNYVVRSSLWDNSGVRNAGAVTWGDGSRGISGEVNPSNSLVGSQTGDKVGSYGVVALTNGNYVVSSPDWDNGGVSDAGAVTWGNGSRGISGEVNPSNSLVGSQTDDEVGISASFNDFFKDGVVALTNGNYVV
ncbi:MAG: hypothetical protein RH949_16260 [Coleofasciculus sp. A1-SPW-01]|uniref:hypothetical protein n=1 Tax=Coleofasciculus sp. A1-SPW-01 TaxID=3070819 RepID=UPI0032FD8C28